MNFRRLKVSLENNADQEPSLSLAIRAFDTLLQDMEDESGLKFAELPMGTDSLAPKLVSLCKKVQAVYEKRDSELQRGRALLDPAMKKLEQTAKVLSQYADADEQLAELQTKEEALQSSIQDLLEKQKDSERLLERIAAEEKTLEELKSFDAGAAQNRLEDLRAEKQRLETEKEELRQQQERLLSELESEKRAQQELNDTITAHTGLLEELKRQLDSAASSERLLAEEIHEKQAVLRSHEDGLAALREKQAALELQIAEREQELEAARNMDQTAAEAQLEQIKDELSRISSEKQRMLEDKKTWIQERNKAAEEIAALKKAREETENAARAKLEELRLAQERAQEARKLSDTYQEELEQKTETLCRLQSEVSVLESESIPEKLRLIEEEKARKDKLAAELEARQHTLNDISRECDELNAQLESATKALLEQTDQKAALAGQAREQQDVMDALQAEIRELEQATDREKYESFQRSFTEKRQELEQIKAALQSGGEELESLESELAEKRQKTAELTEKSQRLKDERKKLEKLEVDLGKVVSAGFEKELMTVEERLALLEEQAEELNTFHAMLREKLGRGLDKEGQTLFLRTRSDIKTLSEEVGRLAKSLTECAEQAKKF